MFVCVLSLFATVSALCTHDDTQYPKTNLIDERRTNRAIFPQVSGTTHPKLHMDEWTIGRERSDLIGRWDMTLAHLRGHTTLSNECFKRAFESPYPCAHHYEKHESSSHELREGVVHEPHQPMNHCTLRVSGSWTTESMSPGNNGTEEGGGPWGKSVLSSQGGTQPPPTFCGFGRDSESRRARDGGVHTM